MASMGSFPTGVESSILGNLSRPVFPLLAFRQRKCVEIGNFSDFESFQQSKGLFNEVEVNTWCGGLSNFRCSKTFRVYSQQPLDSENKFYKQLGMFSLRKRIEDSVLRAEMLTPTALEYEVAKHANQEQGIKDYNVWDDVGESNDILMKLADSAKLVDNLKDLKYKAEEAKLITELAELDAINYALIKQAYSSSLDVTKFLDKYEMSKFLNDSYDGEGACITIEAGNEDVYSEKWAGQLTHMYIKWAERQGYAGRIVEKSRLSNGDVASTVIELEFKYAYGYLSGENGVHCMIRIPEHGSLHPQASLATVNVIPLFIESSPDLLVAEKDILVSYPSHCNENTRKISSGVQIHHIPTGLEVQSTGERSRFANKMKALNRLKAKLLVILKEQGVASVEKIKKENIMNSLRKETRKYVFWPRKMVHDLKSGIQIPDLSMVLNGNLDPLISAQLSSRQTNVMSK